MDLRLLSQRNLIRLNGRILSINFWSFVLHFEERQGVANTFPGNAAPQLSSLRARGAIYLHAGKMKMVRRLTDLFFGYFSAR